MAAQELYYFKFVTALIDLGIWAQMSSAARALYPVLMRFSDPSFKPVYPGTRTLLELTGFKQKSSLRKARRELVTLGLISVTEGSGRKNTFYHFRFDWAHRDTLAPPGGSSERPGAGSADAPVGVESGGGRGASGDPGYNKIQISINNNVHEKTPEVTRGSGAPLSRTAPEVKGTSEETSGENSLDFLKRRFGERAVELAGSECRLAGISDNLHNIQKILYQNGTGHNDSWVEVKKNLSGRISPGSLELIEEAFVQEENGVLIFTDRLPEYLKELLKKICRRPFFEPDSPVLQDQGITRQEFWQAAGADI